MHYYVFKITEPTPIVKNCEFLEKFEVFKDAKNYARRLRGELPLNTNITIKMVHASSELHAEEILQEKREKTVVMEWEK